MNVIDRNIIKFGFYGFLKNLKFFEPFFYLYLLSAGLSYFQIGVVISVRELSAYLFEIPTGAIADVWGRRRSILFCFVLYCVSFLIYFTAHSFRAIIPASAIFGLGDAFRLGTHKAIIFDYLDDRKTGYQKARVYGFTRSVALAGSALSAIGAGAIVLWAENYRAGFLFSVVPYLMAVLLVFTYPVSSHDRSVRSAGHLTERLKKHVAESLTGLKKIKELRVSLVNSAIYDSAFKAGKDYIQPMIQAMITGGAAAGVHRMHAFGDETAATITISAFYLGIYGLSAVSANRAYLLNGLLKNSESSLNALFLLNILAFAAIGLSAGRSLPLLIIFFMLLFVFFNLRRPILLEYMTGHIPPRQRATMLSVDSQLRSLGVIVLAPALGLIADHISISAMFLTLAAVLLALYFFIRFFPRDSQPRNTLEYAG